MTGVAGLILATTDGVPGRETVEALGLVRGASVRARHMGIDVLSAFRNLVGGELRGYGALLDAARDEALARMKAEARALGADAVVGVRLQTATIAQGTAEIVAYGTAVRLA
jgi:uncharacterized protein YbjQ (UPF0145 family)